MTLLVYAAIGITCIGALVGRYSFDTLVDIEFERFPDQWLRDGKPSGGRLSSRAASFWRSGFAAQDCFYRWMTHEPAWADGSREAQVWLRRMRAGMAIMVVGLILIAGVVFIAIR